MCTGSSSAHLAIALMLVIAAPPARDEDSEPTGTDHPSNGHARLMRLTKRVYERVNRSSRWLGMRIDREEETVNVTCELCDSEQAISRFPIRTMDSSDDAQVMRSSVQCLSDEYIERARFMVQIRDFTPGKSNTGFSVPLRDAVLHKTPKNRSKAQ